MSLQKFLFLCLGGMLSMVGTAAFAEGEPTITPLNVIVILVDNVPADLIGAYGNKHIQTPHIDRLAKQGLTLDHAYAASGVCSPTRATLMTGLLPSQTGVHNALPSDVGVENWSAVGEYRTLPKTLSDAGYRGSIIWVHRIGPSWVLIPG